jgi:hypothetical protein
VTPDPGTTSAPEPRRGRVLRALALTAAAVLVVALAFTAGLVGRGLLGDVFSLPGTETVDRSEPAVLLAVRDMAELRAASGQYHVVLDVEQDVPILPSVLAGERTLFVALGTVDAAVDLAQLSDDAIEVSEDGTGVTLTLPPAELTDPRIDPDGSYVYDRQQGLLNRLGSIVAGELSDDQALYQQATDMLAEAAGDSDLRERAEANTTEVLRTLLEGLGFTDVDVVFEPGAGQP